MSPAKILYVALPFNDLRHPALANKWLPKIWPRTDKLQGHGRTTLHTKTSHVISQRWERRSSCLGHWIEMRDAKGTVCFAQWQNFGPDVDNDAPYVFGFHQPSEKRSGLDVSPAVANRFGITRATTLAWRFVRDEDVTPGLWLDWEGGQILIAPNSP